MTNKSNEQDPLTAQKRLFGTLKKIVNKTERYFEIDDDGLHHAENNDSGTSYNKKTDPAYKYINKENWKSLLNEEERDFLSNNPSPLLEGEVGFKNRFAAHKKFKQKQSEQMNALNHDLEENKSIIYEKNKVTIQPHEKEKMTNLICSECGYPLKIQEDIFCPECGCKVIYPSDETNSVDNAVKNLDKEEIKISNEETKKVPTSHNDLPIDILVDLKSFFEEKLINEDEYNHLRKSALKISKDSDSMDGLGKIRSISREKLTELRTLFNERLIDQDEYDDLRKNLIDIE